MNEFNKARAVHMLATYGVIPDLEKGGEGSRGGKIIGHTSSGKPVYEDKNAHEYHDFTTHDHHDAYYAHTKAWDNIPQYGWAHMVDPKLEVHNKLSFDHAHLSKIENHPKFDELVSKRIKEPENENVKTELTDFIKENANSSSQSGPWFNQDFDPKKHKQVYHAKKLMQDYYKIDNDY